MSSDPHVHAATRKCSERGNKAKEDSRETPQVTAAVVTSSSSTRVLPIARDSQSSAPVD